MTEKLLLSCPVCGDPKAERVARCVRCSVPLEDWWPIDDALSALERAGGTAPAPQTVAPAGVPPSVSGSVVPSGAIAKRSAWLWVPVLSLTLLVGVAGGLAVGRMFQPKTELADVSPGTVQGTPSAPQASASAAPNAIGAAKPGTAFVYHVQSGDSPWRVAASLTGDGRRWRAIWAEQGLPLGLHPGDTLRVVLGPER